MEGEMHNAEIRRLWNENQRLREERNASQCELGSVMTELNRKNVMIEVMQFEHEIHCDQLMKRGLELIEEIPAVGPLRNEVKDIRSEVTRLCAVNQDLSIQVETATKDLARMQGENKEIPILRDKIDRLHHQLVQSTTERVVQFCSKILQQLDYDLVHSQVLFLTSTCERAHQIKNVMQTLGGRQGVKIHACVDGNSIEEDKHILSAGVHLVVGTPWRVSELLCTQNQALHPDHVRIFVLDEPDEMLSKGFDRQIHDILPRLPGNVEAVALYPTMPKDALEITRKLMNKSVTMNLWQSIVFW